MMTYSRAQLHTNIPSEGSKVTLCVSTSAGNAIQLLQTMDQF